MHAKIRAQGNNVKNIFFHLSEHTGQTRYSIKPKNPVIS